MSGLQSRSLEVFFTSDMDSSQISVSFIIFNEANPLAASVFLFLFFKITAMVEWDVLDWGAVTITDFSTL